MGKKLKTNAVVSQNDDGAQLPALIAEASDLAKLRAAQSLAARKLLQFDGEIYPADGCAITLAVLLQNAGIAVADIYLAFELSETLEQRGWTRIPIGQQKTGDVGSTCGDSPKHGTDHIYLVMRAVNADEMVIVDNQATEPHFRWASGNGRSPTRYFLRADS